jgi:hypothetical protein
MALHIDILRNQFIRMGEMALHLKSMNILLDAGFMDCYPPPNGGIDAMTDMGLESAPIERWWYAFLDKRY